MAELTGTDFGRVTGTDGDDVITLAGAIGAPFLLA